MKAIIISQPGEAEVLHVAEREIPLPGNNEVLIKVYAAGLNYLDILQRKGKYPVPAGVPADIPGLDVAGIIESCGANVSRWKVGDKVCALLSGAGYAEYAVVDAGSCLPIPGGLTYAEAASLPEVVFTVWHNVFQRGQLKQGENFLVHGGSSGIGITAIQLAKLFGSKAFATAGSDEKCQVCIDLGAVDCINYRKSDFEAELKGVGIDVVLDMIGDDYTQKNINIMNPEGRIVHINAKNTAIKANIFSLMQKRIWITGSTLRGRELSFKAELAEDIEKNVWPLIQDGLLKPVIFRTFPLSDASEAHRLMESSNHIGKIILEMK